MAYGKFVHDNMGIIIVSQCCICHLSVLGQCKQSPSPGRCRVHLHEPCPLARHHGHDEEVQQR